MYVQTWGLKRGTVCAGEECGLYGSPKIRPAKLKASYSGTVKVKGIMSAAPQTEGGDIGGSVVCWFNLRPGKEQCVSLQTLSLTTQWGAIVNFAYAVRAYIYFTSWLLAFSRIVSVFMNLNAPSQGTCMQKPLLALHIAMHTRIWAIILGPISTVNSGVMTCRGF